MKGKFNGPLKTLPLGVVSQIKIDMIQEPFRYTWFVNGVEHMVAIPSRFITDYASTGAASFLFPPDDPHYAQAAVVHDFLCMRREAFKLEVDRYVKYDLSRKDCDDIFLMAMEALECPRWKRNLLYSAVRVYAISTLRF